MTVLHPNRRVARISVERLSIELGGELPLLRVSGAIGKRDNNGWLPVRQTKTRAVENAVQFNAISSPVRLLDQLRSPDSETRGRRNRMMACRHPSGPSGFVGAVTSMRNATTAAFPTRRAAVSASRNAAISLCSALWAAAP